MNYTEKILTLRDKMPPQVFKAVRFHNSYPERFTGHLIYYRDYYNGYDLTKGDILDERILRTLQTRFEKSHFVYSELLLTDQQLTDCLTWTRGGAEKSVMFYFMPETDYDNYVKLSSNGQLKHYHLPLNVKLWVDKGSSKIDLVPNEMIVHVPLDELENLIKTIKNQ